MRLRSLIFLVPLVLVAGCNKSGSANDKRSATGEVLQGTTTDAMIPLGQLTSQPPLLPPTSKGPTTPEQAADQGNGTAAADVTSAASGEATTPAATGTPAAPASATP